MGLLAACAYICFLLSVSQPKSFSKANQSAINLLDIQSCKGGAAGKTKTELLGVRGGGIRFVDRGVSKCVIRRWLHVATKNRHFSTSMR